MKSDQRSENRETTGVPSEVRIDVSPAPRNRTRVDVSAAGNPVHVDVINIESARDRQRLKKAVASRVPGIDGDLLEEQLVEIASQAGQGAGHGNQPAQAREYVVNLDADDPDRRGLYRMGGDRPGQLTNFGIQITEDVTIRDDHELHHHFILRVDLHGEA